MSFHQRVSPATRWRLPALLGLACDRPTLLYARVPSIAHFCLMMPVGLGPRGSALRERGKLSAVPRCVSKRGCGSVTDELRLTTGLVRGGFQTCASRRILCATWTYAERARCRRVAPGLSHKSSRSARMAECYTGRGLAYRRRALRSCSCRSARAFADGQTTEPRVGVEGLGQLVASKGRMPDRVSD